MKVMTCNTLTLEQYITEKLNMLTQEFKFKLTKSETSHLCSLKTETAVDRYVRDLFKKYL